MWVGPRKESKNINPKRDSSSHIIIPTKTHGRYRIYCTKPTNEYELWEEMKWFLF